MQEDDLVYYNALEGLGDGYESSPESEECAEDPEEVSVAGEQQSSACLRPKGHKKHSCWMLARSY